MLKIHATFNFMGKESFGELNPTMSETLPDSDIEKVEQEKSGEQILGNLEAVSLGLDTEGRSRFGEHWDRAVLWAKDGFDWAKRPSDTYPEAVGKAALYSLVTTAFLAPVFLFRNCSQVYNSRRENKTESRSALA